MRGLGVTPAIALVAFLFLAPTPEASAQSQAADDPGMADYWRDRDPDMYRKMMTEARYPWEAHKLVEMARRYQAQGFVQTNHRGWPPPPEYREPPPGFPETESWEQRLLSFTPPPFPSPVLVAAYQRIRNLDDDCRAAVDLKLFLDYHEHKGSITVDRPWMMALKLVAIWKLPGKYGTAGSLFDWWQGWKNRAAHLGTVANLLQTYEVFQEHLVASVAENANQWRFEAYEKSQREAWSPEEVSDQAALRHQQSLDHLDEIDRLGDEFERAVETENALHQTNLAEIETTYRARMDAIAADERDQTELNRRARWLQDNPHSLPPGIVPRPLRDRTHAQEQGEQRMEWMNEALPGGPFHREERARAGSVHEQQRLYEKGRHHVVLRELAYHYERNVQAQLTEVMRLQIERETLHDYALPLALDDCEEIGKRLPERAGFVSARHHQQDWYCTNRPIISAPVALPQIIHR